MAELKISQMTQATEEQLTDGALMEVAVEDGSSSTGYSTKSGSLARLKKYAVSEVADELLANQNGGWVRKNLLKNTAVSKTVSGITATVNDDGSISFTGTATAQVNFDVGTVDIVEGQQYTLTGCPTGGGSTTYQQYIISQGGSDEYGSGRTFTGNATATRTVRIIIRNAQTVNNLTFYPMVRPATIEDSTYVPYAPSNSALNADLANSVLFQNNINIASMITMESGFTLSSARAVLYGKRLCQLYIVVKTANALSVGTEYNFGTLALPLRSPVLCPLVSTDLVGIINNGGSFRGRPIVAKAANSSLYLSAICILANEYSG